MIPRYSHPEVTELWSLEWTYAAWLAIETRVLIRQAADPEHPVPQVATCVLIDQLTEMAFHDDDVEDVLAHEEETRHDVAAFLAWLRDEVGEDGRWIHYGLTSSDVVDTAQGMRFKEMYEPVLRQSGLLQNELTRLTADPTMLVGRTHGQAAEPTSMGARAWHWSSNLTLPITDLVRDTRRMQVAKLSGPVGNYAHNSPKIEAQVAQDLLLQPHGPGASQIASRAPLAAWASSAARFVQAAAKVGIDIRLMNMMGEATVKQAPGQVGSSSMAHKRNPIREEQLSGMARLAQGYADMLQPLSLWLERDISNSSVERVAVPDLWHIVMHTMDVLLEVLRDFEINAYIADLRIDDACNELWVHTNTLAAIQGGMPYEDAREWGQTADMCGSYAEASAFMRNYPKVGGYRNDRG